LVAIIHEDLRDVSRVLRQLFWSDKNQWIEVVKGSVAARGGCTDDYPKSSSGFRAWDGGTARMRQIFRREGYVKGDDFGIETIVHHELRVRVAIMNADAGTCDRDRSPRNRTEKRAATERVTDLNNQIEMFKAHEIGKEPDEYPLWYLYIFDNGKTVRAELSRPIQFKSGYFEKFSERIFIIAGDDWSKIAVSTPEAPTAPDFEIKIRRR
jgi:hypothetical protein